MSTQSTADDAPRRLRTATSARRSPTDARQRTAQPPLVGPRRHRPRPADGRARRDHREHRAALARRRRSASRRHRQWIVTAYALAFGSLLLLGGRLADLFGRKADLPDRPRRLRRSPPRSAAPPPNFDVLVTARAAAGRVRRAARPGRALAADHDVHRARRNAPRRSASSARSPAPAARVGLLLGGVLTEYLSWRWSLYVNLVFAVVAFVGGCALLRHGRRRPTGPSSTSPARILVSAGLFGIVYGFSNAETHGWGSPLTWGFLASAASLLVGVRLVADPRRAPAAAAARRARPQPRRLVPGHVASPARACSASSCS